MHRRDSVRHVLDTYIVARGATMRRGLRVPANKDLVVGHDAVVRGSVSAQAGVYLASGVRVLGPVTSVGEIVVGARARVDGAVDSGTAVMLQNDAWIAGNVRCAGPVRIVGAHVEGTVRSGGDIELWGDGRTLDLKAAGRIRTLPADQEHDVRNP